MAHVFSTTSSSASLPENMKAAKGMGVVNCFGTMVSTVTVSHREQLLDVERYNEMP